MTLPARTKHGGDHGESEGPNDPRRPPDERREAVLYQYDRCCDDWRHHDAIIWEMPLAAVTANAVIIWAANSGEGRWQIALAWAISAFVVGVMSLGLEKQVGYARQIQVRIREIEDEFGLPKVTAQVGRPGMVSGSMIWMLRILALIDAAVAIVYAVGPGRIF